MSKCRIFEKNKSAKSRPEEKSNSAWITTPQKQGNRQLIRNGVKTGNHTGIRGDERKIENDSQERRQI